MGIAMRYYCISCSCAYCAGRGIHKTRLEAIVTCAAADDITAWCLLAVVIAIKAGDFWFSICDFASTSMS
jgi:Kef-type K+ transport system membrane component KefB